MLKNNSGMREIKYRVQAVADGSRTARRLFRKAVQQGRSSPADLRFTSHASRFTAAGSAVRTPLADFVNSLLTGLFQLREIG